MKKKLIAALLLMALVCSLFTVFASAEDGHSIYTFDKLSFSGKDFDGNKIDDSVFKKAELTWIKVYYYSREDKFSNAIPDLRRTAQFCEEFKDADIQVLVVLHSFEKKLSANEADSLLEEAGVDFKCIPVCEGLRPLCTTYMVTNAFADSKGRLLMPFANDSKFLECDEEEITEARKYALGHYPEYGTRLDQTMPGSYDEETTRLFLSILTGDEETANGIEAEVAKREAKEKDMSLLEFSTEDSNGKECDSSMLSDAELNLLFFWEPWSTTCINQMYYVKKLYDDYKDKGLQVIGVYSAENGPKAINAQGAAYPNIVKSTDFNKFATGFVPTFMLVDGEGKIITHDVDKSMIKDNPELSEELLAEVYVGAETYEMLEELVTDYLKIPAVSKSAGEGTETDEEID